MSSYQILQKALNNNFNTTADVPERIGDYVLRTLELDSPNIDKPINIVPIMVSFEVYEDIFSNSLRAELVIADSFGLKELVPIIGEETISVEFYTRGITELGTNDSVPEDSSILKTFRVYKVSPIATPGEHFLTYTLHLCTPEFLINQTTKIQKTFVGKTISEMVQYLFDNYIKKRLTKNEKYLDKKLNVEPTKLLYSFTMPNWSPFKCLNFLASRAISNNENVDLDKENQNKQDLKTRGAIYVFYESLSKFNFISLETKFAEAPKRIINYSPNNVSSDKLKSIASSYLNIEEYRISHLFNVNENLKNGLYGSKLITHDIVKMKYDEIDYNYIETEGVETIVGKTRTDKFINDGDKDSVKKISDTFRHIGDGKLCSNNLDVLGHPESVVKLYPTSFNHNYDYSYNPKTPGGFRQKFIFPNNVEQYIQFRSSQFQQLQNIKIDITLNGDSSLHVGDIVEFNLPSFVVSDNREFELDVFLSGKFLVSKIRHHFTKFAYKMDVQLIKDTFNLSAPSYDADKYGTQKLLNTVSDELNNSINPNYLNIVEDRLNV